jgi:hypothetical protein
MMIGTIFALFFAPNIHVLVAGEVLCGKLSFTKSTVEEDSTDDHRYPMGCIPKCGCTVRLRSSPSHIETLSHYFHQYVLGYWPILCRCRDSWLCRLSRRACVSHTLWCTVALASSDTLWASVRTRVSFNPAPSSVSKD